MKYVDAGYAIGLATLAAYAVSLVVRRRRVLRVLGDATPGPETRE